MGATSMFRVRSLRRSDSRAFAEAFAAIGWTKSAELFDGYRDEQESGLRWVGVVDVDEGPAGYVTVRWLAEDPVLRSAGIPEILDLNVLPAFRGRGIGSALMAAAELEAGGRGDVIGLRVGLHAGYGAAQRMYVLRGYVPDGTGAAVGGESVAESARVELGDDLTLRLTKSLTAP